MHDDAIDSDPLVNIQKKIYRFNLTGTNVNALPNVFANGKTIEQMTLAELATSGVVPITIYYMLTWPQLAITLLKKWKV